MRISSVGYSVKQGVKNIRRNLLFSLASIGTIIACLFIFGLFYIVLVNFRAAIHKIENTISISVFFNEDISEEGMQLIGEQIKTRKEINTIDFISADQAWQEFSEQTYDDPEAAEIVLNCGAKIILNPLEGCESAAVFTYDDIDILRNIKNKVADFIAEEIDQFIQREKILFGDWIDSDCMYDYAAVAPLIEPSLIKDIRNELVHVDCSGGMADGSLVSDRRGFEEFTSSVDIIYELDKTKTKQLLFDILKNYK